MENNLNQFDKNAKENLNGDGGYKGEKVYYRVIENLFQTVLPIHGDGMDKYDSRVIKKRLTSKVKAQALAQKLQIQSEERKLAHHLRYEVELYTSPGSKKASKPA